MIYIFNNKTLTYKNITSHFFAILIISNIITMLFAYNISKESKTSSVNKSEQHQTVTASCYRATIGQCDNTPLITADGSLIDTNQVDKLRWIAISRDLEKKYKMGEQIIIEGVSKEYDGIWTIRDRMNKRFKNKIDFLISNEREAGLFKNVKLFKIIS